jgi:hypothetical protein
MPTASYEIEYNDGGWTAIDDDDVIDVSIQQTSASSDSGTGFGDQVDASASIQLILSAVSSLTWERLPVRVEYTIGADTARAFVGVARRASGDMDTVTWECDAMIADLPNRTKNLYSPLLQQRPPATATTASSIEDPTDGSYRAGLINWVLWQAGGRPYEQAGSYPSADFYYSLEQSIFAPDWSWVAGEDGYAECLRLVRAVGGQLYQGLDGVIYYQQPLTMVGSSLRTFTVADFKELSWEGNTEQLAATITCAYTPRYIAPTQRVIEDTTLRVVEGGATITIALEPQWPLYSTVLDSGTLREKNITATFFDGRVMAYHASTGFTTTVAVSAMQVSITFTNNTSVNCQISKIILDGAPLVAGETGTATAGTGNPTKTLEDNIFVQNEAHANALTSMALSFYGVARPVRTLSEVVYDPDLDVGDSVALTVAAPLSLTAAPHRIIDVEIAETGIVGTYKLVDTTGVPQLSEYYLVKSTAQTGPKKIAW